jgi:integrase
MQTGSVKRHGRGWRGYWREDGRSRATKTTRTKGEARRRLNTELDRLELGDRYRPPITLRELTDRWLAQYTAAPGTIRDANARLVRPLAALGNAQADDVTTEAIQRFIATVPVGKAFKRDMVRTLRAAYAFGVDAGIVAANPAKKVRAPKPIRGERIIPFESWAEVETVAEECGRWGPLVVFMADSGARPAEAIAVEHRHVTGSSVELPGQKTEKAWRTVHLTERGVAALAASPRALTTRCVFHIDGRPISWAYFTQDVWRPALVAAGLERRAPYNLRHTFAYWSLRAGVPIADLAREMGHEDVSRTFQVYGGWCREMGERSAAMREAWAQSTAARLDRSGER